MTDVSLIVLAYDEEFLLGDTLEAIRREAPSLPESSEILVVDDASTDGARAIAHWRGARVISSARERSRCKPSECPLWIRTCQRMRHVGAAC